MSEETSEEVTLKLDLSIVKKLDQEEQSRCENKKRKCSEAKKGVGMFQEPQEVGVTGAVDHGGEKGRQEG